MQVVMLEHACAIVVYDDIQHAIHAFNEFERQPLIINGQSAAVAFVPPDPQPLS